MKEIIYIGTTKVEYDKDDGRTENNLRKAISMVQKGRVQDGELIRPKNYREDD